MGLIAILKVEQIDVRLAGIAKNIGSCLFFKEQSTPYNRAFNFRSCLRFS